VGLIPEVKTAGEITVDLGSPGPRSAYRGGQASLKKAEE
jgi:hypothetical protein